MTNQIPMAYHTAVVNGIKMHYVVAGSGPPVFLLHGFPEFWYAWRHQIPVLAERYTVVAPDLRGYGYREALGGLRQAHDGRRHPGAGQSARLQPGGAHRARPGRP